MQAISMRERRGVGRLVGEGRHDEKRDEQDDDYNKKGTGQKLGTM